MGEMRNTYKLWSEDLKGRNHLEDVVLNGRIILKLILIN
jgi:hypothetical protein